MKGLDSFNDLRPLIPGLKADGFSFVVRYLFSASKFKVRLTKEESDALVAAGLKVAVIFQNSADKPSYFTVACAQRDAADAVAQAKDAGHPRGATIYFAADYDATGPELRSYFEIVAPAVRKAGYTVGVYTSGKACQYLKGLGLVDRTWLSQSTGYQGYQGWLSKADMAQGKAMTWRGIDIDLDTASGLIGARGEDGQAQPPLSDCEAYQTFLKAHSIYGGEIDGDFGPLTIEATLKFYRTYQVQLERLP